MFNARVFTPVQLEDRWLVDGAVVNPVPVSMCRAMGVDVVIAVDLNGHRRNSMHMLPQQMKSRAPTALEKQQQEAKEPDSAFMDILGKGKEYIASFSEKFSMSTKSHPGMIAVMSQSMDILEQRHKRARLMGDPPDVCLVPQLADIGTMEFHRAAEAIEAGRQSVRQTAHLINSALGR